MTQVTALQPAGLGFQLIAAAIKGTAFLFFAYSCWQVKQVSIYNCFHALPCPRLPYVCGTCRLDSGDKLLLLMSVAFHFPYYQDITQHACELKSSKEQITLASLCVISMPGKSIDIGFAIQLSHNGLL